MAVKVVKTEKDGNCLFASLALGLNHLSPDDHHKLTAAEVRAKIAVHLKKNEDVLPQDLGQGDAGPNGGKILDRLHRGHGGGQDLGRPHGMARGLPSL